MYKPICLLLLLTVFATPFNSQKKPGAINSLQTTNEAGKPKIINPDGKTPWPYSHSVDKGLTDRLGNIWFATTDGIYRYDGKLFTNYRLMDGLHVDHVSSLLEDKAGNIWIGASCGIVRCRPAFLANADSASFKAIKILAPDGRTFMADMQNSNSDVSTNMVTQMIQDRNGDIWFSVGYNLYRSDDKSVAAINTSVGEFFKTEKEHYHCTYPDDFGIHGIYQDKGGNILISTVACSCGPNVTYRLDASRTNNPCILNQCKHDLHNPQQFAAHQQEIAASFSKISNEDGNTKIAFSTVLEDKEGNVWIGSDSGVYKYVSGQLIHFTRGDILSTSVVSTIYQDKQGNIWFGTGESATFQGNGLFRYNPSAPATAGSPSLTHFTTKDGLCNNGPFKNNLVTSITEDSRGKLWVSGYGGACYYNGKNFTGLTKKHGFTEQPVKCIVKDKTGNPWFGAWELGLYRYDGISLVCFTERAAGL